jgi:HK97 family phage prohead protease
MSTYRIPKTFDEYVRTFDVVPRDPQSYLRRFQPTDAEKLEIVRGATNSLAARSARARPAAAGRPSYAASGAAPARRVSSSPAVRVAAAVHDVRASGTTAGTLVGYAALYGRPSGLIRSFVEILAPGAFRSTLARIKTGEHDLLAFTEHDRCNVLGRVSAGNLTVEEDSRGLRFVLELPDTQLARDTRELVRRGILKGMSFSFSVIKDSWGKDERGRSRRTVHDLLAYEISIVGSPAYPATSVMASRNAADPLLWRAAALRALSAKTLTVGRRIAPRGTFPQVEHR